LLIVWLTLATWGWLAALVGPALVLVGLAEGLNWHGMAQRISGSNDPRDQGTDAAELIFAGVALLAFGVLALVGIA
jgi:hypothetical protein